MQFHFSVADPDPHPHPTRSAAKIHIIYGPQIIFSLLFDLEGGDLPFLTLPVCCFMAQHPPTPSFEETLDPPLSFYWGIPSSDGIPYGLADFFFFSPSAAKYAISGGQTK